MSHTATAHAWDAKHGTHLVRPQLVVLDGLALEHPHQVEDGAIAIGVLPPTSLHQCALDVRVPATHDEDGRGGGDAVPLAPSRLVLHCAVEV